jgi:hypothetical protein
LPGRGDQASRVGCVFPPRIEVARLRIGGYDFRMLRWTWSGLVGSLILVACAGPIDDAENNGKIPAAASGGRGQGDGTQSAACAGMAPPEHDCAPYDASFTG